MSVAAIGQGSPISRRSVTKHRNIYLAAAASIILLLALLPVFSWLHLTQMDALFSLMKLKASAVKKLNSGYSVFTFLSFVQESKQGILGLWSFVLLLIAAATAVFHLWGIALFLMRDRMAEKAGLLAMYSRFQCGMIFSLILAAGTLGLVLFANRHYGMTGFQAGFPVYVSLIVSVVGYLASKSMEKGERIIRREHGLIEEVRRNWILFLFLIPCFVFFLINNYLPMAGIYFAFTQFNFRDSLFASPFVGFKNFEFLLHSEILHLTTNTILYNLVFIVAGNVLQIFFAILISQVSSRHLKKPRRR